MFRVVVGEALGCVFLHSYMKSYSRPIKGEVFFFCLPRHMHAASPKRVLPHKVTSAVSCAFFFFGRGAAASARQTCSNGQHVTRQSDHFRARKRDFAPRPGRHPGVLFVGAAICVFVGLSRADFGLLSCFVLFPLFFLLAGKAGFGAARVPLSNFRLEENFPAWPDARLATNG